MVRFVIILSALAMAAEAAPSATDLARQVTQISLDPDACYRVTDLSFFKEDLHVYLTSGYITFAKPIEGKRVAALFSTDVEAGDAEVLLIPPYRGERLSLASFTESPNLDEHFKATLMIFTDSTATDLEAAIKDHSSRKNSEMGALMADHFNSTLRNLAESFLVRVVHDLLSSDAKSGIFYMGVTGSKLGNFDIVYDSTARDQIVIGQLAFHNTQSYFDTWTSFPGQKQRKDPSSISEGPFVLDNYRIEATVQPDLTVSATTRVTLTAKTNPGRALPFWISRQMRVTEAKVDGVPAEVFHRESLRATLIRGSDNEEFLVIPPVDLEPGKPHEIEFRHEGAVISKAGKNIFFVNSRGIWYPRAGAGFARYDLTFRYPLALVLVCTGDPVSDRTEDAWHVSRFRAPSPIRFAGFNLGSYDCVSKDHEGYKINVCANREVEAALKQMPAASMPLPFPHPEGLRTRRGPPDTALVPALPPNPSGRLEKLAEDVSGALQFMTSQFGPPPVRRLTVSPIPGGFGQGFPGLIYLSTLSYLDPSQRPPGLRNPYSQMFFSDVLDAHEVAHQWWGNLVTSAGYEDDWIMESLADYSAIMYLEKKQGSRALDTVLDSYRAQLLDKKETGRSVESYGPITWGRRLISSHSPDAWRVITYEKGAWIIHMLRRRLGDERFTSMLRDICEKYRFSAITTEQFRQVAQRFAAPKSPDSDFQIFFDTWIYGTGIPAVKLSQSVRGTKVTGTVTASGAGEDFSAFVPVEVQQGRQKTVYWLRASSDGSPFSITLRQASPVAKLSVAAGDVLMVKK